MKLLQIQCIIFLILVTSSCNKIDHLLPLEGNWELEEISGGRAGEGFEVEPEVTMEIFDTRVVMFADNHRFMIAKLSYEEGEHYDILHLEKDNIPNELNFFLPFDTKMGIMVDGNELRLNQICHHCYHFHFQKEK